MTCDALPQVLESRKTMPLTIVFDPLQISQTQIGARIDRLPQPQLRVLLNQGADPVAQTLYTTEATTISFLQKFLPDIWARAVIEKRLPSQLVKREFGIEMAGVVDDIIGTPAQWERLRLALTGLEGKWSEAQTLDFLLRVFYDIPEGALSLGEEYFALTQLGKIEQPVLTNRLRGRFHELKSLASSPIERRDMTRYLLVSAVAAESGKPIPPRAILGERTTTFSVVPPIRWEEIFRYLAAQRRSFLKAELEAINLSTNQQETLLELMDVGKDTIFQAALQRRIEGYIQRVKAGQSIGQEQLEFLRHHLFAPEFRGKLDALNLAVEFQKTLGQAASWVKSQDWIELKKFYVEQIAPLLEAQEEATRKGLKIPEEVSTRFNNMLEQFDRAMANTLAARYETLVQEQPQETVLDFARALRNAMSTAARAVVLFVDALSFDLWLYLRKHLKERGFAFDEASRLSLLPSATRFTKQSLFQGDLTEGFEPDRAELSRSLDIPESEIRFERVADRMTPTELVELIGAKWRVLILSFNTLDTRLGTYLAPGDLLHAIDDLADKWSLLLDEIKQRNIPLLIVSDHGFREVRGKTAIQMDYAGEKIAPRWALREHREGEVVPEGSVQIGDYVLAVGSQVLTPTNHRYEHGGVSWRELVVPIVVGKPSRTLQAPIIALATERLSEQETSILRFDIQNANDVDLEMDLALVMENLPVENLYLPPIVGLNIPAHQTNQVTFNLRVGKIQEFTRNPNLESIRKQLRLDCVYRAASAAHDKKFPFSITIRKNIRVTDRGQIEKELEELGL